MPSLKRKIAFYHLTQEQKGDNRRSRIVPNSEVEDNFRFIYNQMTVLGNQCHAARVLSGNVYVVVEVVRYDPDDHFAFIKIGHQNHANTTSLRDQNTLEATNVPMQPSQRLELFTYCYIDFTTCIVSYISTNAAPRVSALRAMLDHYLLKDFGISSTFSAIMSTDIIDMIRNKRVSRLVVSVAVAVPSDDVLEGSINVSRRAFDRLQNVRKITYTYAISAKRFRSVFNNPEEVGEVVAVIREEHGDNLQSLKASAAGDNEVSQMYDLLQHNLTQQVTFDADDISHLTADDFFNSLSYHYRMKRNDLLRYIRND